MAAYGREDGYYGGCLLGRSCCCGAVSVEAVTALRFGLLFSLPPPQPYVLVRVR